MKSWFIKIARKWAAEAIIEWLLDQPLHIKIPAKYVDRTSPATRKAIKELEQQLSILRYRLIADLLQSNK